MDCVCGIGAPGAHGRSAACGFGPEHVESETRTEVLTMVRTIEAIYEHGLFRPVKPLERLRSHWRVRLAVEPLRPEGGSEHLLSECVGILPDEAANEMRDIIQSTFGKVNLDEWQ
ncbi:MAG: hypothetical protein CO096_27995 [Armatimonadetes bacterium CG_4_9_14_3_um_filter_66_14]|nr:MAG: hypothetical protein COS85_12240 [Armatimonadetes bacterium CG07_land_8_20_14_0_80_59_28]PJB61638.1 MAG: hypothetical protein CO096_27995 [Armatimonadetes bacterium CG_4_9_14_3_um_filter_66_14]